jgi:hypothetical protein
MKKTTKYLLAVMIGFACGFFLRKPEYEFSRTPPHFDPRQKEIIQNVYGKILGQLKDPSSFYVSEVVEKDSKIVVYVSSLESLQDGEDKRSGEIRGTMDAQVTFVFDKGYNLISTSKGG